jgi:hypothetical protein
MQEHAVIEQWQDWINTRKVQSDKHVLRSLRKNTECTNTTQVPLLMYARPALVFLFGRSGYCALSQIV